MGCCQSDKAWAGAGTPLCRMSPRPGKAGLGTAELRSSMWEERRMCWKAGKGAPEHGKSAPNSWRHPAGQVMWLDSSVKH